jgi:hypothetical protein
MRQHENFTKGKYTKRAIAITYNFEFLKRMFLSLFLGIAFILICSFEMSDKETLPTDNHLDNDTIECKDSGLPSMQQEESLVNTFLDYIPGLREYLFRFKRTDLKKTC